MTTLQKSVTDKDLSCRKLKEQLDALEKETAAKLGDMDQYKKDIQDLRETQRNHQSALDKLRSVKEEKIRELKKFKDEELEKKRLEEEEQRRIKQEKERQWQEKLRRDEEEKQRKLQEEREAKLREEEERERQARLHAAKEQAERERRAQEEDERKRKEEERRKREAEERKRREEDERREQERRRREEEDRKKREEEMKKIEEERRKLEDERRKLEEERKRQEEERRRQEAEQLEEEKRRLEEERKREERRRAEEVRQEEERRKEREEEERRRQRAQEAAIRDAEERKRKEEERKRQGEEDRRRREEERKKLDEERRRKQQEEQVVSAATSVRLKDERQNNSSIVAALLRGLEERKGSRQPLGTSHRKSAALTKFKALYPFSARNEEELSFEMGDIIEVDEMIEREEGWLYGGFQGKMGWFPESYVEKQHKSETPSKAALNLQAVLSTSRSTEVFESAAADASSLEEYVALYTYKSPEPLDLTFTEGDTILVSQREGEWWTGSIGDHSGHFPSNYVKPKETDNSGLKPGALGKKPEVAQVTSAYTASGTGQLNLSPGQLVVILSKNQSGWRLGELQARGKKRQKGWFPASLVKQLGSNSGKSTPANVPAAQVIAIYDYTAANQDELSFSKSQIINVLDKSDTDWWKAEINGVTGLIPTNYVKLTTTESDPSQQCK
ncbi:intersectin-2b [Tachysurus ichikawai]